MKVILVSVVSVLLLTVATDLWLVREIEHRIEDRLDCRLGVEVSADVAWWRGLPALASGDIGTVRLAVPVDELGGGRGLSVSGQDGHLVVETDRMGASVVLQPSLEDGRVVMEVVGVQMGGREVGGLVASILSDRLAESDLGAGLGLDRLPDAVRLTGVEVDGDSLVVEADVDPDALPAQERTGCS